MKTATSATVFRDAVGMRMSVTYSVFNETTGEIIEDNRRVTRVVTDQAVINEATALIAAAQEYIEALDT